MSKSKRILKKHFGGPVGLYKCQAFFEKYFEQKNGLIDTFPLLYELHHYLGNGVAVYDQVVSERFSKKEVITHVTTKHVMSSSRRIRLSSLGLDTRQVSAV
jgi:hypothetical protein